MEPRHWRFRHRSRTGRLQLIAHFLRCLLEIVEGALLLRSRLNHLFGAMRRQVDEAARLLTAHGCHIAWRTSGDADIFRDPALTQPL